MTLYSYDAMPKSHGQLNVSFLLKGKHKIIVEEFSVHTSPPNHTVFVYFIGVTRLVPNSAKYFSLTFYENIYLVQLDFFSNKK